MDYEGNKADVLTVFCPVLTSEFLVFSIAALNSKMCLTTQRLFLAILPGSVGRYHPKSYAPSL